MTAGLTVKASLCLALLNESTKASERRTLCPWKGCKNFTLPKLVRFHSSHACALSLKQYEHTV